MKLTEEQIKKIKEHPDEGIVGTLIIRKVSRPITTCLAGTKITPVTISVIAFLMGLVAAFLLALGEYKFLLIGGILVFFTYVFDNVDGEIARLKGMVSNKGGWLDTLLDKIVQGVLFLGICVGLYSQTNNPLIWVYGFIAVISVYMSETVADTTTLRLEKDTLEKIHADFFLTKLLKKLRIKQSFLTLGIDVRLFIIALGAILNQLIIVLWFFMIIQNLYWIITMVLIGLKKE